VYRVHVFTKRAHGTAYNTPAHYLHYK
jgi:hypothetical protein